MEQSNTATATNSVSNWVDTKQLALRTWWQNANVAWRSYVIGGIATLVSLVASAVGLLSTQASAVAITLSMTLFGIGLVIETYGVIARFIDTKIGTFIGLILAAMTTALAMAMASTIVNEAVGVVPGAFTYTISFMSTVVGLQLLPAAVLVLGGIMLPVAAVLGALMPPVIIGIPDPGTRKALGRQVGTWSVRLLAGIVLVSWAITVRSLEAPYHQQLVTLAQTIVFKYEMYPHDPCAVAGEHVARLNDDVVLVGRQTADRYTFQLRSCSLASKIQ